MREALAESRPLPERMVTESAKLAGAVEVGDGRSAQSHRRPGLLRRLAERRSPRRVKVSSALRLYHEVLGLEHLHYGLWNGEGFTLEGLKTAQERFSRHLCSWVPEDVHSVLDVGCGIGSTAAMLRRTGYEVEGLSPDPYHREAFLRRVDAPFHLSRFQEFEPPHRYDLVLMSESAQYIWLDRLFPAVRRSAAPGGFLLVADYFTVDGCEGLLAKSGHPLDAFLDEARREGFSLERQEDITDRTAPTLDLARRWIDAYLEPCVSVASQALRNRHPHLTRMANWLFRRRFEKLRRLRELVDGEEFRRHKRYLVLRFRVDPVPD